MEYQRYLAARTERIRPGRQTSVNLPGLINMGSGTPDFEPPDFVFEAMRKAVDERQIQYTLWAGTTELREAIAVKLERENRFTVDPEREILVTSGAQEALMSIFMALLDPGDEIITPAPFYGVYGEVAHILGASLVPVETTVESDFTVTADAVRAAITPRTKALVLVSPNNPTGTVLPEETLREMAELALEHNLLVISDEIYEHYVFGSHRHVSLATLPGMRERTISIYSLSKGYALTGLRVGYVVAPAPLIEAVLPFHHAMTICASTVAQSGAVAALREPRDWFDPILAEYDRRRRLWMTMLDGLGLVYGEPQGAYYVAFDVSPTGLSSAEFSKRMREEAGVILGSAGANLMRGSLMQASPQFEEGLERIGGFVKSLR
ncbi:MAG: pyridoxal phosphate-dependent aminotransferase [Trueperaceae bacterium]|nr:MAG: pyridoxal phosphate-dependent aminotransferase [Trueperaceae bacterium]